MTPERQAEIRARVALGEDDVGDLECAELLNAIEQTQIALTEVREAWADVLPGIDTDDGEAWHAIVARLDGLLAALPADLAAEHDRRVEARALRTLAEPLAALVFERLCQLRFAPRTVSELAGVLDDGLRARANAADRGGR